VTTLLTKEKPRLSAQVWSLTVPTTAVEAGALLSGSIATVDFSSRITTLILNARMSRNVAATSLQSLRAKTFDPRGPSP
jgi:hypothetical protein